MNDKSRERSTLVDGSDKDLCDGKNQICVRSTAVAEENEGKLTFSTPATAALNFSASALHSRGVFGLSL